MVIFTISWHMLCLVCSGFMIMNYKSYLQKRRLSMRVLTLTFILLPFFVNAATTYTSTGTGNWSSSFSSSGSGSPVTYIIQSGHTITVNVSGTSDIDTIRIFGTLNFNNGRKLDLSSSGVVLLESGGSIGAGNGGSKFRFSGGTDISGPFSLSGPLEGTGTTGAFIPPFLPVDWLGFEVKKNVTQVHVSWKTASELNNNFFVIQTSADGNEWIDGPLVYSKGRGGNSDEVLAYSQVLDENELSFVNDKCFIRIKQVDFDFTTSYSSVKWIKKESTEKVELVQLDNNQFTTHIDDSTEDVNLKVFNMDGSTILDEQLVPGKHYQLLVPGMYLILFEKNGKATTQKMIVH